MPRGPMRRKAWRSIKKGLVGASVGVEYEGDEPYTQVQAQSGFYLPDHMRRENVRNQPAKTQKEGKVQEWKIKPEMKKILKEYRKFDRVSQDLGATFEAQLEEADKTRKDLEDVEEMKRLILNLTPEDPIYELEGQDLQIRY